MTHITCRLTAKNRYQLQNPTLSNRVWATFTFFMSYTAVWAKSVICNIVADGLSAFVYTKLSSVWKTVYAHDLSSDYGILKILQLLAFLLCSVWKSFINSKNRAGLSYQLAINHLADLNDAEMRMMRGRRVSRGYNGGLPFDKAAHSIRDVPDQIDWRLYGTCAYMLSSIITLYHSTGHCCYMQPIVTGVSWSISLFLLDTLALQQRLNR